MPMASASPWKKASSASPMAPRVPDSVHHKADDAAQYLPESFKKTFCLHVWRSDGENSHWAFCYDRSSVIKKYTDVNLFVS
ncbi:hypothetical protein NCCP436_20650 [Pseudomonas sp. NCCP-436]|nr:hypothetical protein NCCP436_20650 [Pseudomonas sp. NCCP-436]